MINIEKDFLQKVATFTKMALSEVDDLQDSVLELQKRAMAVELEKDRYAMALKKTADVLYDTDFLTDDREKRAFVKKAMEDPVYVARFLEKVCEAADVTQIGRPARVAANPKLADYDPVMAKAFGLGYNTFTDI